VGLEEELQRVLQTRSSVAGGVDPDDPVEAVHRGIRRRRLRQRLAASSAAFSVVAIALLTTNVVRSGTSAQPVKTVYEISRVPYGFQISDLSFLSGDHGYALGSVPCGSKRCTVLLETDSGGSRWTRRPAPLGATVVPRVTATCAGLCVSHLRLAKAGADGQVGYAYGPGLLMSTDDGWQPLTAPGPVEALEAANGTVVRVTGVAGGGHLVQTAPVGTDQWSAGVPIAARTFNAQLSRQGDRVALVTYDNNTGPGAESDVSDVRVSDDGGVSFTKGAHLPCDADAVFESVALGADREVLVLCTRRTVKPGASAAYVRVSTDGGLSFARELHDLPAGYTGTQVAAPSQGGWLVAADSTTTTQRVLLGSPDDGRTWDAVAQQDPGTGLLSDGYLDITSSSIVTWVGPNARWLLRSKDAGSTWTTYTFP
jgi:hypothetical protein